MPFFLKIDAASTTRSLNECDCESADMEEFDTTPCFYSPAEDTSLDLEMNQSNVTMHSSAEG